MDGDGLVQASRRTDDVLKIEAFPVEVLSAIAVYIPGDDLARLYFCGSKMLNGRLSSTDGGITEFRVDLDETVPTSSFGLLSSFPCLKLIKLETKNDFEQLPVHLKAIPSSITAISVPKLNNSKIIDFSDILPNLVRLELSHHFLLSFSALPPHLEHLSSNIVLEDLSKLPSSLISLDIEIQPNENGNRTESNASEQYRSQFSRLSSLQSLKLATRTLPTISSLFPQNLLSLDITNSYCHDECAVLSSLPQGLLELKCKFATLPDFSVLPRGLTDLEIRFSTIIWSDALQESLPPNLTRFKEGRTGKTDDDHTFQSLPISLRFLALGKPSNYFDFGYLLNLEELHLPDCVLSSEAKLPKNLTLLSVRLVESLRSDWPENLRTLAFKEAPADLHRPIPPNLVHTVLPLNLTSLNAPMVFWPPSIWSMLPKGLRTLHLVGSSEYEVYKLTSTNAKNLPRFLQGFSLIGSNIIHNDSFAISLCNQCPDLLSLQLEASYEGLTTKCFSHLSPSLVEVGLKVSSSIADSDFSSLPRMIRVLLLSSPATNHPNLSLKILNFLPPRLHFLRLPPLNNRQDGSTLQHEAKYIKILFGTV